jgi:hypothetical protein
MNTARKTLLMVASMVASIVALGTLAGGSGCGGAKPGSPEPLEAARDPQRHATRRGEPDKAHMGEGAGDGDGDADEAAAMPPELQKFHAVLAPRWHAKPGPERIADTCGAIGEFRTGADAVVAAQPPAGRDAAAWSAGGKQLAEAVAALDATCQAHDAAGFEPAFAQVHERFHGLLEAGEPNHGEHDEH